MLDAPVAISAPGKVLFTGGFLVLDRKHTGLVFGLDARIHVHVQVLNRQDLNDQLGSQQQGSYILAHSPQFRDSRWLYKVADHANTESQAIAVSQVADQDGYTKTSNKFVQTTLQYVLTYLSHVSDTVAASCKITILADDSYYSQSESVSKERKGGFADFGVPLSEAHKTGLGSSAALVTALVGALLAFRTGVDQAELPQQVIHNLAQAAHCAAQGKVGSGFDIAAAVFGSCLYRRFSPSILEAVGDASSAGFGERLHQCVDDLTLDHKWDVEISTRAVQIPDSLLLMMCDVDCGSETPSMVRKVLEWRKDKPVEADLLWTAIQHGGDDLSRELLRLSQSSSTIQQDFRELADVIQTIRSLVREESEKSQVPIEPKVITELLDDCTSVSGVLGGVAPGAGGYDAVALLLRNNGDVVKQLTQKLEGWKAKESGTGVTIGNVRLLDVKQAYEGARNEDPKRYEAWC